MANKSNEYINGIKELIEQVQTTQSEPLIEASKVLADTLAQNGWIYILGTGHSHMLAEEMFYRAGGLVRVKPILEEGLMLHHGASKSTKLERLTGYANIILDDYGITNNDCLIIISNSGGSSVSTEAALYARRNGIKTIALTSITHSTNSMLKNPRRLQLFKLCDIVLDNRGCYGDASVAFGEKKVAPTSTVIGALILNSIVCLTIELLEERGVDVETFLSSNVTDGDEYNTHIINKYKDQVRGL